MSEFFYNLSLQKLSIEDDTILITFEAMNKIHQIIADNLSILKFEFMKMKSREALRMLQSFKIPLFQWKHPQIMFLKLIWHKEY